MRASRSCASARCGWRSSPCCATRVAASNWRFWRSISPRRRNTRLCGSLASWAESAFTSSDTRASSAAGARAREHLGRGLRRAHLVLERQLALLVGREPLPLVPLLHRFAEAPHLDQGVAEQP